MRKSILVLLSMAFIVLVTVLASCSAVESQEKISLCTNRFNQELMQVRQIEGYHNLEVQRLQAKVESGPLTDADRMNGIQWRGTVDLSFVCRVAVQWHDQTATCGVEKVNGGWFITWWLSAGFGWCSP